MATSDELTKIRVSKLEALRKRGIDPYPAIVRREHTIKEVRKMDGRSVSVCGRIMGLRGHGKIMFADLVDESGKIQVVFKADEIAEEIFGLLQFFDLGDFMATQGKVGKTQAGEVSLFVTGFQLLSKSLRPLPDQWSGLKDIEERYRQRYVDLVMNEDVRKIFLKRSQVISFLHKFFDEYGFIEVETPILQPVYGGASAKPFVTHHNTLDIDLYLRISDELYLKRLIVGGFEKVYEIGHDFRNEGVDRAHNPEFTMLEFYWAYADYEKLMEFTEGMFAALIKEVQGALMVEYQGVTYNFTPPWPRISYRDAVLKHSGVDIDKADSEEKLKKVIKEKGITLKDKKAVGFGAVLDALYKQTTRPHLSGPLFLTDRPTAFVSLAKRLPEDPRKTASFQLLVAGEELINAYNELNDPIDQAERWKESEKLGKKGKTDHEAFDADYIRALEYGMPPTAGWGLGIDRLVAILTNQHTLKDVILFPILRPEK
ncbi:lysine--tRNA ligase [Candidatus Gottesmanbacteria bacterium RIFCSPLOWO2_01_FULL_43_11b]|uniref:Lysine--tRNA ligase n=1 Tax=Candidatus Gottesmanbacteria bacterium RIFCSPLOWO2_01_FULL_43_11b TaxID=1798392 RepID=A0A1F6AI20_9BACT|nr:MAG: lysine--tRNA ligase [Candidatus Gottesmanbacteria bacterium RIFCSPLOWO2_01_FULL_43_11b]